VAPRLPALLLAVLGAAVGGCGASPYPGEPPNSFHVFLINETKGFDPAQCDEEMTGYCVYNVYDQLYQYHHLKRPFELEPCLAAAMPDVSEDGLTYTIRLRKDVRFADDPCFPDGKGRGLVASDFVYCMKRFMDAQVASPGTWLLEGMIKGLDAFHEASANDAIPKSVSRTAYTKEAGYPEVEGLRAPDPYTIEIELVKPYPELTYVLAMAYMSIYPREAVGRYGEGFADHPVGTGPYVVEHYDRQQKIVFVRNPNYWEEHYPTVGNPEDEERGRLVDAGKRLPLNDRVVATVFKEQQPQWLYFMSGFLDRTTIPKDNFDTAMDTATMQLRAGMRARGVTADHDAKLEVIYDCFNMYDPVLGQKAGEKGRAIRRAMSLAYDEEWTNVNLYNNRVERVEGPILKEFPEFDPAFRNPWKRRLDESMEQARVRARKILADAGYPGGKGIPDLYYEVTDSTLDEQFFYAFSRDMARIGITVKPNRTTWQEMVKRTRQAKAQIWGIAWGADYPAAQNFLQLFYGPFKSPGSNASNYLNPEYDRLYEEAQPLPPGDRKTALSRRMQEIVVDDAVWIFKYRRLNINLIQPWLHGYRYNDLAYKFFKYCRVEDDLRARKVAQWNPVQVVPILASVGLLGLVVAITLWSARRQVKGW
jgi:ABC-type transport system substrate-binding protein